MANIKNVPRPVVDLINSKYVGMGSSGGREFERAGKRIGTAAFVEALVETFPKELKHLSPVAIQHLISDVLIVSGHRARSRANRAVRNGGIQTFYHQVVVLPRGGRVTVKSEHPFTLKVDEA